LRQEALEKAVRDKWDDQTKNGEKLWPHDILLRFSHAEEILFFLHDVAIGRLAGLCIRDFVFLGPNLSPKTGCPS
jgi:hypothetical protein